jgi:hypothetical protein
VLHSFGDVLADGDGHLAFCDCEAGGMVFLTIIDCLASKVRAYVEVVRVVTVARMVVNGDVAAVEACFIDYQRFIWWA